MREEPGGGVVRQVGRLLEAARVRSNLRQWQLAERVGTSQQWLSRVERGEVNLRLRDADRLFSAVGARLVVQVARRTDGDAADPDVLSPAEAGQELAEVVDRHQIVWRRFADVPLVVAGRLAALAQGLPVRPGRLDLVVAEAGIEAADRAMGWMNAMRWSDVHQDWTGFDFAVSGPGPRRWRCGPGSSCGSRWWPRSRPRSCWTWAAAACPSCRWCGSLRTTRTSPSWPAG